MKPNGPSPEPSAHPARPGLKTAFSGFFTRRNLVWIFLGFAVGGFALFQSVRYSFLPDGLNEPVIQGPLDLQEPPVQASAPPPGVNPGNNPAFRMAVAPLISPENSFTLYSPFVKYLAEQLGKKPQLIQRQTNAEVNELVRDNDCDIAIVGDYAYMRGERDFGMTALVVPQIKGAVTYQSYILVSKSSQARSLLDLKGEKFASADILSNTGWLFPAVWLKEHGQDPDHFFLKHLITGSNDRSIQAVMEGLADGAAVNSQVYDLAAAKNPLIPSSTRIIQKSPLYGAPPIVISRNMDPKWRDAILQALLGMHLDPIGRIILSCLKIDRYRIPAPGLYDSVRANAKYFEAAP